VAGSHWKPAPTQRSSPLIRASPPPSSPAGAAPGLRGRGSLRSFAAAAAAPCARGAAAAAAPYARGAAAAAAPCARGSAAAVAPCARGAAAARAPAAAAPAPLAAAAAAAAVARRAGHACAEQGSSPTSVFAPGRQRRHPAPKQVRHFISLMEAVRYIDRAHCNKQRMH